MPDDLPVTTGSAALDELIDGVRISDNLVVLATDQVLLQQVVAGFVRANGLHRPVALARSSGLDAAEVPEDLVGAAIAASPAGELLRWDPVPEVGAATAALRAADERLGAGAAFVIDSLSTIAAVRGDDAALELLLATCPHLYQRRSVALWPVRADLHTPAVLARLEEVTQVVIELVDGPGGSLEAEVRKADGRPATVVGRRVAVTVTDADATTSELLAAGPVMTGRQRLGRVVRDQRTARGISQAELARRIGISASALSQVERGVRGLSGERLMRVWEVLEVPFGPTGAARRGYRVTRRGSLGAASGVGGAEVRRLLDDPVVGQVHEVVLAPGGNGRHPLPPAKVPEMVLVRHGVVDLEIGGFTETLHAGDTVVATAAAITGWGNPGGSPCELLWVLQPTGG